MHRNFKQSVPPTVPLQRGIKGEAGGCKLVLMKMGNSLEKTQPPESPFAKGDLNGIS